MFLILKSDNIENSRTELKGIVFSAPSNQTKITFFIILPFNLAHLWFFLFHIEIEGKCGCPPPPFQIIGGGPGPPCPPPLFLTEISSNSLFSFYSILKYKANQIESIMGSCNTGDNIAEVHIHTTNHTKEWTKQHLTLRNNNRNTALERSVIDLGA